MSSKSDFASMLTRGGDHGFKGASECECWGMSYGCTPDCPVFERGQCEIQEENSKIFNTDESKNQTEG